MIDRISLTEHILVLMGDVLMWVYHQNLDFAHTPGYDEQVHISNRRQPGCFVITFHSNVGSDPGTAYVYL